MPQHALRHAARSSVARSNCAVELHNGTARPYTPCRCVLPVAAPQTEEYSHQYAEMLEVFFPAFKASLETEHGAQHTMFSTSTYTVGTQAPLRSRQQACADLFAAAAAAASAQLDLD